MQRVEKIHLKPSKSCTINTWLHDYLLAVDNKLKIHQKHLQFLAMEMYKCRNKLNPSSKRKAYEEKNTPYSVRRRVTLLAPDANTRKYVINSLKFRKSVLWNNLPANLKECQSLLEFKLLLKQNGSLLCTCSAHRIYFKICVFNHLMWHFLVGWFLLVMTRNVPTLKVKNIININKLIIKRFIIDV